MGALMLTLAGTAGGIAASRKHEKRTAAVREFISFLNQAEAMICYCGADIREILSSVHALPVLSETINNTFASLNKGNSFEKAWKTAVGELCANGGIDREDKELFMDFCEGFGTLGADEEISKLHLRRTMAEQRLMKLLPETENRRRLCRVVGTFCGVLLAAVII